MPQTARRAKQRESTGGGSDRLRPRQPRGGQLADEPQCAATDERPPLRRPSARSVHKATLDQRRQASSWSPR
eukprot:13017652-Alexandrium_andersonii.AAC.1